MFAIQNRWLAGLVMMICGVGVQAAEGVPEIVDLRTRPSGQQAARIIARLAQGNEGRGELKSLTLNTRTGEVHGIMTVRHRQVSGNNPLEKIGVGGRKIITYDSTWNGQFRYNVKTFTGHATLDVGRGIKLKTTDIQAVLNGDVNAILAAVIPNPGNVAEKRLRNEYEQIKADIERRHGAGNVYFASKRFVDWASPERVGEWVIRGIVTGGVDVGRIMSEVARQAKLELGDFTVWLQRKGLREAASTAEAILSGRQVNWPHVSLHWQTVGYFSQNVLAGKNVGPEIRVTHAAFYLVWKGNIGQSGSASSSGGGKSRPPVITGGSDSRPNQPVSKDLRNTETARQIEAAFSRLAQGNEGKATITALNFDARTGMIQGSVSVRHRHVVKFGPNWAPQRQTAYDYTHGTSFRFDPKSGQGHGTLDLGRGVKLDSRDLARLVRPLDLMNVR